MAVPARLVSLATCVPRHAISQAVAARAAERAFASRLRNFARLARVFETSGVRTRRVVRPVDWYFEPLGWPERSSAFVDEGGALFVEAASLALARAGLSAADVDCVVSVSSTGIATPSLEAQVAAQMGFRADVERVPVFGLGCAGGVSGLALAGRLASAKPGAVVLMVTVELCSLAFRPDLATKTNVVASALFADGAAACVVRADETATGIATLEAAGQYQWPGTLGIMGWSIDPLGFGVILEREIPPFVDRHLAPTVEGILARAGIPQDAIDGFAFHPGGRKVVDALERAFALEQGALAHERAVLAEFGNMSAPTALFVLERVLAAQAPRRTLMAALGPGFTASCLTLTAAA